MTVPLKFRQSIGCNAQEHLLSGSSAAKSDLCETSWKSTSGALIGSTAVAVIAFINVFLQPTGNSVSFTIGIFLTGTVISLTVGKPYTLFAWNCFLKPLFTKKPSGINSHDHQQRLEQFYESQAAIYDVTRKRLLRGRSTLLTLCGAQLRQHYPCQLKRLAWIDVGGGTGENIEKMNSIYPIENFDVVYLVDITPSLCQVARQRFQRLGWENVRVICADASKFEVPAKDEPEDLDIALITMSYSLSMIESFYPVVDRLHELLCPTGIFGIADFYISHKRSLDPTRQMNWIMRWFWQIWFDVDNVYLHPCRREYIEHKFKTVKTLSARNHFIGPIVQIPYYVWIGAKEDDQMPAFKLEASPAVNCDDVLTECGSDRIIKPSNAHRLPFVTVNHAHGQGRRWRQAFDTKHQERFSTYIYAFTWEDPSVDLEFMGLGTNDRMLVISSGGCNVLEYAARVGPARIHAVDLNPCQNHLLELKLAGISSLNYTDFWQIFGEGYHADFRKLLHSRLSPFLSDASFSYWTKNANFSSLYKTGGSGLAIKAFHLIIDLLRLRPAVERMCNAETIAIQSRIWETEIRPYFLSPLLIFILNNDKFLWKALGVPPAQMQMLIDEGSAYEYIVNTFDPIIYQTHLRTSNYFYYLPLMLRYVPENAPAYLTEEGYRTLQTDAARLDAIKIHTDTIVSVLENQCLDGELTRVVLMDHLDWFSPEGAENEIRAVARKCAKGAKVFWRSAAKRPWYNAIFERHGFNIVMLQIREDDTLYIDRVNMYASFYCGLRS
ncbi:hypothetical protein DFJ77DRAFT_427126 [Powellomyces hirtus]|nr:hypothetical protein DFJ77DRAFT_427126 [Powellomyces hirtus]